MSDADTKLPGRTRVRDVVIDGVLIQRVLNIDAQEAKACAALWATGAFTQLHVGSHENPGLDRLDCLDEFSNLTRLHVMLLDHRVDLSPLNKHAPTLTAYFCNDDLNPLIQAREFKILESITQMWNAHLDLGDGVALRSMFLDRYSAEQKHLGGLPMAPNLRELGLLRPAVTHLAQLGRFAALEKLSLTLSKSLVSVEDLPGCLALKELEINGARKVQDLSAALPGCHGLERLVLMNVSALRDVSFVEKMPELRWLNLMGTDVIDGDMTPLIEHPRLEHVVFTSKKHFSHGEAQVRLLRRQRTGESTKDEGGS